jgi:hypothetical protein
MFSVYLWMRQFGRGRLEAFGDAARAHEDERRSRVVVCYVYTLC